MTQTAAVCIGIEHFNRQSHKSIDSNTAIVCQPLFMSKADYWPYGALGYSEDTMKIILFQRLQSYVFIIVESSRLGLCG